MRPETEAIHRVQKNAFPFLFGGAFIEARRLHHHPAQAHDFPSFSEGLSLRQVKNDFVDPIKNAFPFLFGGAFIEAETI